MDIRHYVNDEARFELRPRLVWRVLLPAMSVWALFDVVVDPSERPWAIAFGVLFALLTVVAWVSRVRVAGRLVEAERPLRNARIDLSLLTSEGVEWVWYPRYVARYLTLEDSLGGRLRLTWVWWSNWWLLRSVAHEWHVREGKPYA